MALMSEGPKRVEGSGFGEEPEERPDLWFLELRHERIVDLIGILEGCEGLAALRVLEKARGIVELLVAPDLADDLQRLLDNLPPEFSARRVPRPTGVKSILDDDRGRPEEPESEDPA